MRASITAIVLLATISCAGCSKGPGGSGGTTRGCGSRRAARPTGTGWSSGRGGLNGLACAEPGLFGRQMRSRVRRWRKTRLRYMSWRDSRPD